MKKVKQYTEFDLNLGAIFHAEEMRRQKYNDKEMALLDEMIDNVEWVLRRHKDIFTSEELHPKYYAKCMREILFRDEEEEPNYFPKSNIFTHTHGNIYSFDFAYRYVAEKADFREEFNLFLTFKLRNLSFFDIYQFLSYQLKKSFQNNLKEYKYYLKLLMREYDILINEKIEKTVLEWINDEVLNKAPLRNIEVYSVTAMHQVIDENLWEVDEEDDHELGENEEGEQETAFEDMGDIVSEPTQEYTKDIILSNDDNETKLKRKQQSKADKEDNEIPQIDNRLRGRLKMDELRKFMMQLRELNVKGQIIEVLSVEDIQYLLSANFYGFGTKVPKKYLKTPKAISQNILIGFIYSLYEANRIKQRTGEYVDLLLMNFLLFKDVNPSTLRKKFSRYSKVSKL